MAELLIRCECGANVISDVGDSIYHNVLRWYQSYRCTNCGNAVEVDGDDEIPDHIKNSIIKQGGMWGLFLKDTKDLSQVKYLLRKEFGFTLEMIEAIKIEPRIELLKGTKNEMAYFNNKFLSKGIGSLEVEIVSEGESTS